MQRVATRPSDWIARRTDTQVLLLLVLATVVLRMPFLFDPLGIDEGGYAYVADRWLESSGNLYGDQWVDRPPLLLTIYVVANVLGGEAPLRLIGLVAAIATVLACAGIAGRVAGPTALRWTGVVAAVLTSSVMLQGHTVNAELPAIALTSAAAWLAVRAATCSTDSVPRLAVASGAVATSALLVKQSFADGLAFGIGLAATMAIVGDGDRRARSWRILRGGVIGSTLVLVAVAGWAATLGPGVVELVDATYGFRLEAGRVLAGPDGREGERAYQLLAVVVTSGLLATFLFVAAGLARIVGGQQGIRSGRDAVLVRSVAGGLVAMGAIGVVGVMAGGSWWTHYLLQLVPMLSIGVGLVVAAGPGRHRSRVARHASSWSTVAIATAFGAWLIATSMSAAGDIQRRPATVGDWLAVASEPGDTAMVTWGRANVLERSGMRSPYPMSWSLPIRVRDPELVELRRVLSGDDAPTWLVRWNALNSWGIDPDGSLRTLIVSRYEHVATVCGVRILRLEGLGTRDQLPAEPAEDDCVSDNAFTAWLLDRIR